jgi:hypothetical protein
MAISDTDKLLVNDGSKTETITFSQFKDGTVLNDSDKFLINDGTKTETITWAEIEDELGPKGIVNTPTVLKPDDGTGSGTERDVITDKIIAVDTTAGSYTCETDTITNVDNQTIVYSTLLPFTSNKTLISPYSNIYNGPVGDYSDTCAVGGPPYATDSFIEIDLSPTGMTGDVEVYWRTANSWQGKLNSGSFVGNGSANRWVTVGTITDPNTATLRVESTRGDTAAALTAIKIDGVELVDGTNQTTLTLAGDKDLDCFEPGDVVQSDWNQRYVWSSTVTDTLPSYPGTRGFDGSSDTAALNDSVNVKWNATPYSLSGVVRVAYNADKYADGDVINDGTPLNPVMEEAIDPIINWWNLGNITLGQMEFAGSARYTGFYAIEVDGKVLVDKDIAGAPNEVKVISKDADATPPTITVDGGDWDPTGVNGDSTVTGKTKTWDASLTVAGPTDLDVLNVGDVVKMGLAADVPYQPVSDAITNVDAIDHTSGVVLTPGASWQTNLGPENIFNGDPSKFASSAYTGSDSTDGFTITFTPALEGNVKVGMYEAGGSRYYSVNGATRVNIGSSNSGEKEIDLGTFDALTPLSTIKFTSSVSQAAEVFYVKLDDVMLVDGETTLTLAGETDLAYFRTGDVVQGDWKQSQVWSNTVTSSNTSYEVGMEFANAWNGATPDIYNQSTWAAIGGSGSASTTLSFTGLNVINTFSFTIGTGIVSTGSISYTLTTSSGTFTDSISTGVGPEKVTIDTGAATIQSLAYSSSQGLRQYEYHADGKLLVDQGIANLDEVKIVSIDKDAPSITVDGGEWSGTDGSGEEAWNQDEVWSKNVTNDQPASPATLAFDSYLTTVSYAKDTETLTCTFDSSIPVSSLRVKGTISLGEDNLLKFGTTDVTSQLSETTDWQTITGISSISSISWSTIDTTGSGYRYFGAMAFEVNGRLLVDQGIGGAPDTEVTCLSPLKAPTDWKVERIEGTTIDVSHATPDDNAQVWVASDNKNQAGTDFYVQGGQVVDEPLLTADVELESSLFSTTPDDADTLKNIVWELNGVTQDAGTTNPYKPTLSTDTTYTVKVKHEGNTLDESPWSDSITFTTGSTRNIYTYYKERVQQLESRLAGIESNEVIDDATDTALLSLIAGLAQRIQTLEESN